MEKMLNFKSGIQQVNKNTNQLPPFTTDVHWYYKEESEIALCVYDISNKKSFEIINRWVK